MANFSANDDGTFPFLPIGVTDASCRILERLHRETSFTDDDDHQICYNGKHYHKYLFDYLTNYLQAVTTIRHSKPLFSYTETNVAHDDVGMYTMSCYAKPYRTTR